MASEESGFTLVELLVVMLILGILAAIAIPSFFNQRDKARDADAKASARTAQTAMETYATDNGGSYAGTAADVVARLRQIEETLNGVTLNVADATADGEPGTGNPGSDTYAVTVTSSTGNQFTIARLANGTSQLECTTVSTAGCPADTDADGSGNWD